MQAETNEVTEKAVWYDNEEENDDDDDERQCYVCWEAGTGSNPLRRDCGCAGSAGWAHVPCLIEAARTRSASGAGQGGGLLDPILRPWAQCGQCRRPYGGPTRTALVRTMKEDRARTWKKRAAATLGTLMVTVAVCALHFVLICSLEKIFIHLHEKQDRWWERAGPAWRLWWEELRWENQVLAGAVYLGSVAAGAAVLWNEQVFVFLVSVSFGMGFSAGWEHSAKHGTGAWVGFIALAGIALGTVVYRNRFALRDELIQIRREGMMPVLLGIATCLFLAALYYYIDGVVAEVLPGKLQNVDRAASDLFERLISFAGWGGQQAPSFQVFLDRIREQFWYCCA